VVVPVCFRFLYSAECGCRIKLCIALKQMLLNPNVEREPLTVP
jgi:hypothetical protein